jgi:hypothetical protein
VAGPIIINTELQGGTWDPTTGIWTPQGFFLTGPIGGALQRWCVFDRSPVSDLELIGSTLITELRMELVPVGWGETGTLTFLALRHRLFADLSTDNAPRHSVVLGTLDTTLVADASNQVIVPIGNETGPATAIVTQLISRDGVRQAIGAAWSGAGGDTTFREPRIFYEQGFTGLSGPHLAEGRADECPKCGNRTTRDTWVRDGWTNMLVCGRCVDPEDPVGKTRMPSERTGVNEG